MPRPPASAPASARGRPLRLLHIHTRFDGGGPAMRTVRLINRFGPACAHSIAARRGGATGAVRHIARGIPVLVLNLAGLEGRPGLRGARDLAAAMRNYDLVLTYGAGAMNAVFAHTVFGPQQGLPPLVHHEDGPEPEERDKRQSLLGDAFHMLALARAQALVVSTRAGEALALGPWKQPREKVHRIATGIDTRAFDRKPGREALPRLIKRPGELWLGTLAELRPDKNLPRLVRAFAALPEPWQLVIAGEGTEREAIAAEAARLGLADRVHLPGHVADPSAAIGLFDLFAISSDCERLATAVIEAMAAGLAIVGPAGGELAATLGSGNAGFVTLPGDEAALAEALARLAADPRHRRTVGAENRAKARAEFDTSQMADRYAGVYARVMGRERFP